MARPPLAVERIVPELVIPRSVEPVDQLIAGLVVVASVPRASTVTRSVPPTVFGVVSVFDIYVTIR